jgi:23S rRNA (uracil1939-C5)-methyltransferase
MNHTNIKVEKLVHGGQGLGELSDGRKVFVWNALPGETVNIRLLKNKKNFAEGLAEEIIQTSVNRVEPRDAAYLSTSPWQIMDFAYENSQKQLILKETMQREHVDYAGEIKMSRVEQQWNYRNKMEYSFFGDEEGLHLALFSRGTHQKQIVEGSSIARPEIDDTARRTVALLEKAGVRASQLKTLVLRCNQAGQTAAALFVKDEQFPQIDELAKVCKGLVVIYSNPKSPASVVTAELYRYGDTTLCDTIRNKVISYDVMSFFQVNVPVFELAMEQIAKATEDASNVIDMYAGVGTIGAGIGASLLVEIDEGNVRMAKNNVGEKTTIIQASTEQALEHISTETTVVFDPPRAGLHPKVIECLLQEKPKKIVYLSCNPATHARDLALLQKAYTVEQIEGYNFFPRTPHIESLAVLQRK